MASKLTEQNIMILGDLTNKLEKLKKSSEDYTLDDFEYEFNKIKELFEKNKLPFKYEFEEFSKNLDFYEEEESSSYEEESSYDDYEEEDEKESY